MATLQTPFRLLNQELLTFFLELNYFNIALKIVYKKNSFWIRFKNRSKSTKKLKNSLKSFKHPPNKREEIKCEASNNIHVICLLQITKVFKLFHFHFHLNIRIVVYYYFKRIKFLALCIYLFVSIYFTFFFMRIEDISNKNKNISFYWNFKMET